MPVATVNLGHSKNDRDFTMSRSNKLFKTSTGHLKSKSTHDLIPHKTKGHVSPDKILAKHSDFLGLADSTSKNDDLIERMLVSQRTEKKRKSKKAETKTEKRYKKPHSKYVNSGKGFETERRTEKAGPFFMTVRPVREENKERSSSRTAEKSGRPLSKKQPSQKGNLKKYSKTLLASSKRKKSPMIKS